MSGVWRQDTRNRRQKYRDHAFRVILTVGSGWLDSFYIDCVSWAFIQTLYRGPGYPLVPKEITITLLTLHSLMPIQLFREHEWGSCASRDTEP